MLEKIQKNKESNKDPENEFFFSRFDFFFIMLWVYYLCEGGGGGVWSVILKSGSTLPRKCHFSCKFPHMQC